MSKDDGILKLSLKLKEKKIQIGDDMYVLKEMIGTQRDSYMEDQGNRFEPGEKGKAAKVLDWKGMTSFLISLCLYSKKGGEETAVPQEIINKWPASVQKVLHEEAQKLNGLDLTNEEIKKAMEKA